MSDFMDGVAEDLDAVFLDLDVFGEKHVVQGKEIIIMYDNEELERVNEKKKKMNLIVTSIKRTFFFMPKKAIWVLNCP